MARRISAMLGIVVVVGLALTLMWRVYLHHRAAGDEYDEPGVVAAAGTAPEVVGCRLSVVSCRFSGGPLTTENRQPRTDNLYRTVLM
ncbi:MAG: hypothetical protein ACXW2F_05280 [Thermoanaerobaculia bacterium]